jgi:integrase
MAGGTLMKKFKSTFAEPFVDFIDWKHVQNIKYKMGEERIGYFDNFLADQKIESLVLTQQLLRDYQEIVTPLGKATRYARFLVVRDFARYYQQIVPESALLGTIPFKNPEAPKPFIFTLDHIQALVQAARRMKPANRSRPHVMAMLIGLLFLTGLRISEALHLTIKDFRSEPYRLFIANSKFGKDRWVLLKDSLALKLKAYLKVRRRFALEAPDEPFFLNQYGNALSYATAYASFCQLLEECRVGPDCAGSRPRFHALRHTFATNCLLRWYREGLDPNDLLADLVIYMGHVNLASTQVYLRATPELRSLAAQRFYDYAFPKQLEEEVDDE